MEALHQWLTARQDFENAALGFLDACTSLKAVATRTEDSNAKQEMIDTILSYREAVAESFDSIRGSMENSQRTLNIFNNLSVQRVPISKLPLEILGRIFSIFLALSSSHENDALSSIILVCTRWYQVAASTATLWNHVDFCTSRILAYSAPSSRYDRIKLFLNRSRGLPIHLHLPYLTPNLRYFKRRDMVELGLLLHVRETIIGSVEFHGGTSYNDTDSAPYTLTQNVLSLLGARGKSDSLQSLTIEGFYPTVLEYALEWPSKSLPQLRELNLENLAGPACPTLGQLIIMLSICPLLHTLRLWNLDMDIGDPQQTSPVQLPNLKLLDINSVPDALPWLSSLIFPGMRRLDVRLDLRSSEIYPDSDATRALFSRSNIFSLTVRQLQEIEHLGLYLPSISNLRVLMLDLCHNPARNILNPMLEYVDGIDVKNPPPRLQALGFMSGAMDSSLLTDVKTIVDIMTPRTLVFINISFSVINEEYGEYTTFEGYELDESYCGYLPTDVEEWFQSHVDNVVTYPLYPARLYHGVDKFLEELASFE